MPIRKSVTVRLADDLRGYVESLGKDFTAGLVRVIEDHMQKTFEADVRDGIDFLMSFAKVIEFREVQPDNNGL